MGQGGEEIVLDFVGRFGGATGADQSVVLTLQLILGGAQLSQGHRQFLHLLPLRQIGDDNANPLDLVDRQAGKCELRHDGHAVLGNQRIRRLGRGRFL
jgi:hypothetical protein